MRAEPARVRVETLLSLHIARATKGRSPVGVTLVLRSHSRDRRTRRPGRATAQSPLVLLGCLALTAYFIHHAINGRHGLAVRNRLIERSSVLDRDITGLEAVRLSLRRDVALLAPDPPHPDMVEEIAGAVLGMVRPGELIIVPAARSPAP